MLFRSWCTKTKRIELSTDASELARRLRDEICLHLSFVCPCVELRFRFVPKATLGCEPDSKQFDFFAFFPKPIQMEDSMKKTISLTNTARSVVTFLGALAMAGLIVGSTQSSALAQSSQSTVSGTVRDPNGIRKTIPGATVAWRLLRTRGCPFQFHRSSKT